MHQVPGGGARPRLLPQQPRQEGAQLRRLTPLLLPEGGPQVGRGERQGVEESGEAVEEPGERLGLAPEELRRAVAVVVPGLAVRTPLPAALGSGKSPITVNLHVPKQ